MPNLSQYSIEELREEINKRQDDAKQDALKEIQHCLELARTSLSRARKLASEHDLTFRFDAGDEVYLDESGWNYDGWQSSSINC